MLSYVLRSPRTIDNPTNLPSPQTEGEKGPEMKNLISLVTCLTACLMLAACTHTLRVDTNGFKEDRDFERGLTGSESTIWSAKRQSLVQECEMWTEGMDPEEALAICKEYAKASLPDNEGSVDDPHFFWRAYYGN